MEPMQYLCLIFQAETTVDALPEHERTALVEELREFREDLCRNGHFIASSILHPAGSAATLRVRGGNVFVADGAFAQTPEQLGECYLIEARDLNDAIRLASKSPLARFGCVEVRPIQEYRFGENAINEGDLA